MLAEPRPGGYGPAMDRFVTRGDPGAALALLTRLPAPGADHSRGARAAWAWPLVGVVVGAAGAVAGLAALALGLPPDAAAGLAIGVQVILTGALHEDGLADMVDGLGGGRSVERRLAIMRDSRIGSYGAVALVLSLGLRWTLTAAALVVAPGALIGAAALSRAGMAGAMASLPAARTDGLSAASGRPRPLTGALAGALALAAAGLAAGAAAAFLAALGVAIAATAASALARRRLGGQTGDVLGAVQQVCEVAALAVLVAAAV